MKSMVRFVPVITPVLLAGAAIFLMAADSASIQPGGLTVHEWGTFTSVAGDDGVAVDWDALGSKDDLPTFVNDFGYRCFKWRLTGTVRMETPVMYFYSPREVSAHVKVQFPYGVITEWYPNGDNVVYESKKLMDQMGAPLRSRLYSEDAIYETRRLLGPLANGLDPLLVRLSPSLNGIDTSLRNLMGSIGWTDVKVQPGAAANFPVENRPSRYYAARGTDAAPITAGGQHEKFLFYRGVGRFQVPLSVRVSDGGKIVVENRSRESVPSVILFENRDGRIGYRIADDIEAHLTFDAPALVGSFPQLRRALETELIRQGLFPKEAQAMVETWRDSWFEEGSRLIYIVPSSAVDAILPLQVEPAPSQTVRVFVGRIELITPQTKRAVESAVAKSDWPAVDRYRRFLGPILERIYPGNPSQASKIEQLYLNSQGAFGGGDCR